MNQAKHNIMTIFRFETPRKLNTAKQLMEYCIQNPWYVNISILKSRYLILKIRHVKLKWTCLKGKFLTMRVKDQPNTSRHPVLTPEATMTILSSPTIDKIVQLNGEVFPICQAGFSTTILSQPNLDATKKP